MGVLCLEGQVFKLIEQWVVLRKCAKHLKVCEDVLEKVE